MARGKKGGRKQRHLRTEGRKGVAIGRKKQVTGGKKGVFNVQEKGWGFSQLYGSGWKESVTVTTLDQASIPEKDLGGGPAGFSKKNRCPSARDKKGSAGSVKKEKGRMLTEYTS